MCWRPYWWLLYHVAVGRRERCRLRGSNPKSQISNTQGCAPVYCHTRETSHAQNYFKHYIKYPQSMGLRSMDFVFRLETCLPEISLWDLCKYLNIWKKPKSKTHLVPKHFNRGFSAVIQLLFPREPGRESCLFICLLCSVGTWVLAQDRRTHSYIPSLLLYLPPDKLPWLRLNSLRSPERLWDDHPPASASRVAEVTSQYHEAQFWGTCFSRILRQWGNYRANLLKWTLIMSSVIMKTPNSELGALDPSKNNRQCQLLPPGTSRNHTGAIVNWDVKTGIQFSL